MKTTAHLSIALGLLLLPSRLCADMVITPEEGYSIVWDGNEGDNFVEDNPAPVPANLATAAATAFSSSELGPELGLGHHLTANLNDGLYGNLFSWISASDDPTPAFAGISLGGLTTLTSFAFGRDNGNNPSDAAHGGQLTDRCLGLYTIQITRVASPNEATEETGDPATGWATIGTIEYLSNDDTVIGEGFTAYYRHEFEIAEGTSGIQATGLRIVVPAHGIGGGTAIDEIELYGPDVVNPDKDGDGFDDEVEVALGTDPDNPASTPESRTDLVTAVEFKFFAAKNKSYRIETSTNLQDWTTVEENIRGQGRPEPITRLYSLTGQPVRHFRAVRIENP